jgi:biotin carboxyl carrier protein
MARYYASLGPSGAIDAIDIRELGPGRLEVALRGRTFEVDAHPLHLGHSLLIDGRSYDVGVEEVKGRLMVAFADQVEVLEIFDERQMRMRGIAERSAAAGRQVVTAPMPGKVVRVLVRLGDKVAQGQGMVIVEAMKMENELRSAKQGTVVELAAREGQAVEGGTKLLVLE